MVETPVLLVAVHGRGESNVLFYQILQACYFANPLPVESASAVVVYEYGGNDRSDIIVSENSWLPHKSSCVDQQQP